MYYPNMMYDYGYFSPFHLIGGVFEFFFWIIIILIVVKLLRRHKHSNWTEMWTSRSALSVLAERFAKGEISKEEYEERKKVLEHSK